MNAFIESGTTERSSPSQWFSNCVSMSARSCNSCRIAASTCSRSIRSPSDCTRNALFEAQDRGAENCILLDEAGFVTEGPGFNVFAVTDGAVATPDRGVLEGITRLSVAELCAELGLPFAVRPVSAAELIDADEIFLSTTACGIMPVSRIDVRILGNDRQGPLSARLRETFWAKRAKGWHATAVEYEEAEALA